MVEQQDLAGFVRSKIIDALEHVVPTMPAEDAPCHRGIVAQAGCAHCQRIKAAHEAIETLRRLA